MKHVLYISLGDLDANGVGKGTSDERVVLHTGRGPSTIAARRYGYYFLLYTPNHILEVSSVYSWTAL